MSSAGGYLLEFPPFQFQNNSAQASASAKPTKRTRIIRPTQYSAQLSNRQESNPNSQTSARRKLAFDIVGERFQFLTNISK